MVKGGIRNALMRLIAGRKIGWWLSDDVAEKIGTIRSEPLGAGAVLCLVKLLERAEVASAEYNVTGWRITIERQPKRPEGL